MWYQETDFGSHGITDAVATIVTMPTEAITSAMASVAGVAVELLSTPFAPVSHSAVLTLAVYREAGRRHRSRRWYAFKPCHDLRIIGRDKLTPVAAAPEAGQKEIFSSWALFILIMLLIAALFTSYMLQQKKIQAVHETVISIFAGGSLERFRHLKSFQRH